MGIFKNLAIIAEEKLLRSGDTRPTQEEIISLANEIARTQAIHTPTQREFDQMAEYWSELDAEYDDYINDLELIEVFSKK